MRNKAVLTVIMLLAVSSFAQVQKHLLKPVWTKREIYKDGVDAKKEIADALKESAKDQMQLFLVFGGNWCYDCHVLDAALRDPAIAPTFNKYYRLVHVDIGTGNKNLDLVQKYKINLEKGVPAVAVVNPSGKLVFHDKGGEFESARSMYAEDLLDFFEKWKPTASSKTSSAAK
jgi:thioredoxin 1